MVNILGEHVAPLKKIVTDYPDWSIHLYGKAEAKIKRKMGHLTIMTDNIEKTLKEIDTTAFGLTKGDIMINQYSRPEMKAVWLEQNKCDTNFKQLRLY